MASIKATVEVESSATPEQVYAYVTAPSNMSEWVNGVAAASWADGSDLAAGGKFNMDYVYRGKTNKIIMEVTALEPGRRYAYHTIEGKYPIEVSITLEPSGTGTKISYTQNALSDSAMTAFAFRVTSWLARPMMRKALRKDMVKMAEAAAK